MDKRFVKVILACTLGALMLPVHAEVLADEVFLPVGDVPAQKDDTIVPVQRDSSAQFTTKRVLTLHNANIWYAKVARLSTGSFDGVVQFDNQDTIDDLEKITTSSHKHEKAKDSIIPGVRRLLVLATEWITQLKTEKAKTLSRVILIQLKGEKRSFVVTVDMRREGDVLSADVKVEGLLDEDHNHEPEMIMDLMRAVLLKDESSNGLLMGLLGAAGVVGVAGGIGGGFMYAQECGPFNKFNANSFVSEFSQVVFAAQVKKECVGTRVYATADDVKEKMKDVKSCTGGFVLAVTAREILESPAFLSEFVSESVTEMLWASGHVNPNITSAHSKIDKDARFFLVVPLSVWTKDGILTNQALIKRLQALRATLVLVNDTEEAVNIDEFSQADLYLLGCGIRNVVFVTSVRGGFQELHPAAGKTQKAKSALEEWGVDYNAKDNDGNLNEPIADKVLRGVFMMQPSETVVDMKYFFLCDQTQSNDSWLSQDWWCARDVSMAIDAVCLSEEQEGLRSVVGGQIGSRDSLVNEQAAILMLKKQVLTEDPKFDVSRFVSGYALCSGQPLQRKQIVVVDERGSEEFLRFLTNWYPKGGNAHGVYPLNPLVESCTFIIVGSSRGHGNSYGMDYVVGDLEPLWFHLEQGQLSVRGELLPDGRIVGRFAPKAMPEFVRMTEADAEVVEPLRKKVQKEDRLARREPKKTRRDRFAADRALLDFSKALMTYTGCGLSITEFDASLYSVCTVAAVPAIPSDEYDDYDEDEEEPAVPAHVIIGADVSDKKIDAVIKEQAKDPNTVFVFIARDDSARDARLAKVARGVGVTLQKGKGTPKKPSSGSSTSSSGATSPEDFTATLKAKGNKESLTNAIDGLHSSEVASRLRHILTTWFEVVDDED